MPLIDEICVRTVARTEALLGLELGAHSRYIEVWVLSDDAYYAHWPDW